MQFLGIFVGGQLVNVMSHQTKEIIVRKMMVNQDSFQLKVSIAQLFTCVLVMFLF
jgi:hypothetical protein